MLEASWLSEYTKGVRPEAAKHNNNESGRRTIEEAYKHMTTTLAVSSEDKKRVHKWMDEFRKA